MEKVTRSPNLTQQPPSFQHRPDESSRKIIPRAVEAGPITSIADANERLAALFPEGAERFSWKLVPTSELEDWRPISSIPEYSFWVRIDDDQLGAVRFDAGSGCLVSALVRTEDLGRLGLPQAATALTID